MFHLLWRHMHCRGILVLFDSCSLWLLIKQKQSKIESAIDWGWPGALVRARRLVLRAGSAAPPPRRTLVWRKVELMLVQTRNAGGKEGLALGQNRRPFGHMRAAKKAHGFKRKNSICSTDREFGALRSQARRPFQD